MKITVRSHSDMLPPNYGILCQKILEQQLLSTNLELKLTIGIQINVDAHLVVSLRSDQ